MYSMTYRSSMCLRYVKQQIYKRWKDFYLKSMRYRPKFKITWILSVLRKDRLLSHWVEAGLEIGHLKIAHWQSAVATRWKPEVLNGYKLAQRDRERSSKRALLSRSVTHLMQKHKYLVSTCVEKGLFWFWFSLPLLDII